ncbi:MAG: hypothetical protein CMJ39_06015 [Phycisphaerae bacterium]|nr:hypothetical protein [Phycisphaerae bacterium]
MSVVIGDEAVRGDPSPQARALRMNGMNTINASFASIPLPQPSIPMNPIPALEPPAGEADALPTIEPTDRFEISTTPSSGRVQPVVNPTAWSPGMWWLLHRYEYLFEGMLPEQGDRIIVDANHEAPASNSSLGRPHWGESNLINPPPAAATLPEPSMEPPPTPAADVNPQPVGTFVDVVA